MIEPEQIRGHTRIRLIVGQQAVEGTFQYLPAEASFVILLPGSGVFGDRQDLPMKITDKLFKKIEMLPDGSLQLNLEAIAENPPGILP